jgi:hypothetical protein
MVLENSGACPHAEADGPIIVQCKRVKPDAARVHRIPPRVRDDRDTPLDGTRQRRL